MSKLHNPHTDVEGMANPRLDDKAQTDFIENSEADDKVIQEKVVDEDARGYTDASLVIDEKENKRLRRMINTRVLPVMCLVYIIQALDKGALGPVSIMGWLEDVNAQGQDFAMTSTVMWIGIIAGEPVAAQLIRRFPVAKILVVSMFAWTALSLGLAFSLSIPPILGNRFLLGFFEATFGPCLVTITVQWYTREEQPWISAIWQSMVALALTFTSIMGWGFYQVPAYTGYGLRGWQWLILVISVLSAIGMTITWFYLPDSPTKARWASDELKVKFVERVRSNNQGLKQKHWRPEQAWETLKDPFVWSLFFIAFTQTLVVGGISKFNSLLINRAFGFDVLTSQLLKIPLSLVTVSFYYVMAFLIYRYKNTLYAMCAFAVVNASATIVLITVPPNNNTRVGLFVAFIFMSAFNACNTAMFLMLSRNVSGSTKKSLSYAATFMAWGSGNAVAPQLFWDSWAPRYLNSLYIHMGLYAAFIILCLSTRVLLVRRNNRKEAAAAELAANGETSRNLHAFEDLTDLENPDFRYCL